MYEVFRYFQAEMPAARMSPLNVVVETPAPGATVDTVSVPVAVRLATEMLPENRPLPWTPRAKLDDGEVLPTPTFPPRVAKYADPVEVRAVVEAYGNVEARVDVAWKNGALMYCQADIPRARMSPLKVEVAVEVALKDGAV